MSVQKYRGVIPAFYACYDEEGRISPDRAKRLARHLVNKGVQGLYVGGSSGECIYQEKEERMALLEAVMEEVKGECLIIAHVACNNTEESCQLAAHAERAGVDAIASIPPIYFRNIPQLAGVTLTPGLFKTMRQNPRVIGVKNSSMPTYDIEMFLRAGGENCVVFNGPDEQFVAGRCCGAAGGIGGTYAAMPELFLTMDRLIREGTPEKARPIQHEVNAIIEDMCGCHGSMYAVIKAILKINENLELGSVRRPMPALIPEDMPKVEAAAARIREAIRTFAG